MKPVPNSVPHHEYPMRIEEVSKYVHRSRTAIYADIAAGKFPKPIKLGRTSLWLKSEIIAYIENCKAERDAA